MQLISVGTRINWWSFLVVLAVCAVQVGCVQRRLTIRSNPPGALVYIDDQEIGYTPVSTPFTYYGTRKIQLIKDGYETVTALQRFRPPWYQIPPLDFVSENFGLREHRDERALDFQLIPQQIVPTEKLRERAEQLRASSGQGIATPVFTPPAPILPSGQVPAPQIPPPPVPPSTPPPGVGFGP